MMRFDRFSERAQDAAARAYESSQRYGHNQVDTEHILLALLEQPEGVIPQILGRLGADLPAMRQELESFLRTVPKAAIYGGRGGGVSITPRVKRVIDEANEEANRLKSSTVTPEHVFLAILAERGTAVARIFSQASITRERVAELVKMETAETAPLADSARTVRLAVDVPLAALIKAVEQLSLEDARRLYERLGERLKK